MNETEMDEAGHVEREFTTQYLLDHYFVLKDGKIVSLIKHG